MYCSCIELMNEIQESITNKSLNIYRFGSPLYLYCIRTECRSIYKKTAYLSNLNAIPCPSFHINSLLSNLKQLHVTHNLTYLLIRMCSLFWQHKCSLGTLPRFHQILKINTKRIPQNFQMHNK